MERLYNTGIAPSEIAPYCILVGDPARADRIAGRFEHIEYRTHHREYVTVTGIYNGNQMTVMGTGMGAPATEMAIVELTACRSGLTLLRCGSCGGLTDDTRLGDVIIATAAMRFENTSDDYADPRLPAVAHSDVLMALLQAADEQHVPHHSGIMATMPSFFAGQGRALPYGRSAGEDVVRTLFRQGVIGMEMEASAVLVLAHLAGHRAGVVCSVYGERATERFISGDAIPAAEDRCIDVALGALDCLSRLDKVKGRRPHWHPGLIPSPTPGPGREKVR